jgi:hypothetical protein
MKKILPVITVLTWAFIGSVFAETAPAPAAAAKVTKASKTAALEAQLMALEKGTWEAVKRHDAAAFAAVCLDDCVEIYGDGTVLTIKEVLDQVPDTEIVDYKIEDMTVTFPSKQTALVRYKIWAKTTYKGQGSTPQWMYAAAVWVKKGEAWKAAYYQETPVPKT